MGRPLNIPTWATDELLDSGLPSKLEPSVGLAASGWTDNEQPLAPTANWLHNAAGAWIDYIKDIKVQNWHASPARITTPASGIKGITYNANAGYWIACGEDGYLYRSISGKDFWTASAQLDTGDIDFNAIATSNAGLSVAVGDITAGSTIAYSSTNGSSWTSRAITWSHSNGISWDQTNANFIIAADNGIFTMSAAFATAQVFISGAVKNAVATNPAGVSVVVGDSGLINVSANSTTWSSAVYAGGAVTLECVMWDAVRGLFVMGGVGGVIATSPDGVTWTAKPVAFGGGTITYLANDGGHWVCGTSGSVIGYSSDAGETWAFVPLENAGGVGQAMGGLWHAKGQFVCGTTSGYIHTSLKTS